MIVHLHTLITPLHERSTLTQAHFFNILIFFFKEFLSDKRCNFILYKYRNIHTVILLFYFVFIFFFVFVFFFFSFFLNFYLIYFVLYLNLFFAFRGVPEDSEMFRNVPRSWFYQRPKIFHKSFIMRYFTSHENISRDITANENISQHMTALENIPQHVTAHENIPQTFIMRHMTANENISQIFYASRDCP